MSDFDQKRADRDAVLYNTDGRMFDLSKTSEKLELVSRPNAFTLDVFNCAFLATAGCLLFRAFGTLAWGQKLLMIVFILAVCCFIFRGVVQFFDLYQPMRWILDKKSGQLCADKKKLASLEDVSQVRAFKFRRRLKLVLELKNGRELHLGWLRFAGKEWAWRHDAAQIAAFLGVPLEIPPL